jgi:small-conductance mechanosensitive channel
MPIVTLPAFQESASFAEEAGAWLQRLRDGIGSGVAAAAEESATFIIDVGAVVASLLWITAIVLVMFLLGQRLRGWSRRRATAAWPAKPNRAALIDQVLQIAFISLAVLFGLRTVGVNSASLVTAFGIIIAALSISLQDVLKNLVAGIYLLVEEPFRHGDRLTIPGSDQDGWVERVSMRVTQLRNIQRESVLVPNYVLFSQIVVNRTAAEPYSLNLRLLMIEAPAPEVEREIRQTLSPILGPGYTPPAVFLQGAGPLGTAANVRVWFAFDEGLRRDVIVALNERFPDAFLEVVSG